MRVIAGLFDSLRSAKSYHKALSFLVSGTVVAQLINVGALPLLTRLYAPSDFGLLAAFVALSSIGATVICLRFEIAIALPESDAIAANLVFIALFVAVILSLVLGGFLYVAEGFIRAIIDMDFSILVFLLPMAVLSIGVGNTLLCWSARNHQYKMIAKVKVLQSFGGVSSKVLYWFLGFTSAGLVYGQFLHYLFFALALVSLCYVGLQFHCGIVSFSTLKDAFYSYVDFPRYSVWEALANIAGVQLPVLLIAYNLSAEAGHLLLAMQLLAIPMGLIGASAAQVYLAQAPERFKRGELYEFSFDTGWLLFKVGVLPILVIVVAAPAAIPMLFGEAWSGAAVIVAWLAPSFFVQFIVSPISMALHILGEQRKALLLQAAGLVLRVGSVIVGAYYSPDYMVPAYAISGFVFYLAYLLTVQRSLRNTVR